MSRRRASEPKIIGAAEAAEIVGCLINNLHRTAGLPEPYDRIRASALWRREDIEKFARERNERRRAS